MDKYLGQDIKDLEERRQFIIDNADTGEEKTYLKNFDANEMAEQKEELAEVSIKINDIEEEIKAFKESKKLDLKPLKEERSGILDNIKAKGKIVTETCYKYIEREEGMTGYYNEEGLLIESRPATRDEMQSTLFLPERKVVNG